LASLFVFGVNQKDSPFFKGGQSVQWERMGISEGITFFVDIAKIDFSNLIDSMGL
jgi:hypothetical protein